MAEALLSYRHWLRQLVDGVEMVQQRRRNTKGRAMRKLRSILLTAMFLAVATPALAGDFPREFVGRWCEVLDQPAGAWTYFERGNCADRAYVIHPNGDFDGGHVETCKLTKKDFDRSGDAGRALRGFWRYACRPLDIVKTEIRAIKWKYDDATGRLMMDR
jgi:hypothetical protein